MFDDGAFSEYDTVLLADWLAKTPLSVLSKNLGVPKQALSTMPDHELYIFQAEVPKTSLAEDRRAAAGVVGLSSQNFSFRMMEMQPTHKTKAGEVRIVDSNVFQASNAIAARMSSSIPEDCANCTGTKTPMNGNTTSLAKDE